MKDFKSKILDYYSLTDKEYDDLAKELSINDLPDFLGYDNIEVCANYLREKVRSKAKILIYGDYDCDGIMSTSIIYLTLKTNDFTPGFYIPYRETDGYGLTKNNIDRFYNLGYRVLVLVDNGITLVDEVEYANSLGMEVVIMDHHTREDVLPNAKFILHPIISNFSKINMSAGSLAFFFSEAYLGFTDEYLLVLGMISTISDLMPLNDKNRIIAKLGIASLNKNKYKNICLLIKKEYGPITERDISMTVAPKINAIGRIVNDSHLFDIVRYFVNFSDTEFISKTSLWINNVNLSRKQMVSDLIKDNEKIDDSNNSIIIVLGNDVKEGLTGLLASRFMDEFNKPTVVLIEEHNNPNIYKGSLRSRNGFNINIILDDLKDILLTYGGHENAGGLSLNKSDYSVFKERFEKAASKHPFVEVNEKYININLSEITKENYDVIDKLSPFGQGFQAPNFEIREVKTNFLQKSRDGKHLITKINPNSSIVYFNYDKTIFDYEFVNLVGQLSLNYYRGYINAQFIVSMFSKK